MKKENTLTAKHEAVWQALELLEPGQHITGARLREHSGVKESRSFHQIIRDLRRAGYPIGSSKQPERSGFFVIRSEEDLNLTLFGLYNPALDMLSTAKRIEQAYTDSRREKLFN